MKRDKTKIFVLKKRCNQCLFSDNKIVSDERKSEVIAGCVKDEKYFNCHKHENVCCRGFYDKFKNDFLIFRLGRELNRIFVIENEK